MVVIVRLLREISLRAEDWSWLLYKPTSMLSPPVKLTPEYLVSRDKDMGLGCPTE
jgi:hypothetical protein